MNRIQYKIPQTMDNQNNLDLKRIIATPAEEKPRFNWAKLIQNDPICASQHHHAEAIAEIIGEATVNAGLLKGQSDILSDENKNLVRSLVQEICSELAQQNSQPVSQERIENIIEEVLVRHRCQDIAMAFVAQCHFKNEYSKKMHQEKALHLIRRDGSVVPWNIDKIKHAVELAFLAQNQTPEKADIISQAVTQRIIDEGLSFIHIETVQDCVQAELMRQGEYKIAEAYILYRAERAKQREENETETPKTTASPASPLILIKNNDGSSFFWDGAELRRYITFANQGLDSHLTDEEIFLSLKENMDEETTLVSLRANIVKNARMLIEKDPVLAVFAARIRLLFLYEEVFGWNCRTDPFESINQQQSQAFVRYIQKAVEQGLLHPSMLKYDLVRLSKELEVSFDEDFDAIALESLEENYFLRDDQNHVLETPQMLWMRVAMGVFLEQEHSEDQVIRLYRVMSARRFCLATPTLYYAGTPKAQMMSSYVYYLEDDMQSIMTRGISDNAFIAKWGGGIAGSWSNVRCKDSRIAGTRGRAPGIIPFLELHQHQLAIANQGSERRRGRGTAFLEIWHYDVLDFINYKKEHGYSGKGNDCLGTALWIPDIFMRRLEMDGDWTLFNSENAYALNELYGEAFDQQYEQLEQRAEAGEIIAKKITCREIWQRIMQRIFETGFPKIAFKDTCNRSNMCKNGIIHASNLCMEHMMNTSVDETAVCNTGALDISKHLCPDGSLDITLLRETISIAVDALDAMIDASYFPSESSQSFARRYRAIGLGMMGLQNAYYNKNLAFDSDEALQFAEDCSEIIAYESIKESVELAKAKGACPIFPETEWAKGNLPCDFSSLPTTSNGKLDWLSLRENVKTYGIRNAYLNAYSPTRKIARLLGCYPELSPATKNVFTKRMDDNYEMMIISPEMVKALKKAGVWNKSIHKQIRYFEGELGAIDGIPNDIKEVFSTAYMIDNHVLIESASQRQRWIDQSQSLRLFLGTPNLRILSDMFLSAWKKGIKSIYEVKSAGFFQNSLHTSTSHAFSPSSHPQDHTDAMIEVLSKFHHPIR